MTDVVAFLKELIAAGGPIPISQFVEIALTARADSYYMRQDPFGAAGDFVTAPEISQVFGECVGLWCVDVWQQLGRPYAFDLVELGPGRGTLMNDVLRVGGVAKGFSGAAHLAMVEVSPVLRSIQAATLGPSIVSHTHWYDRFQDIEIRRPLIVIANEFFDALPAKQFVKTRAGWSERMVGFDECGTLSFHDEIQIDSSSIVPASLCVAPEGSIFEQSLMSLEVGQAVGSAIRTQGGGALFIDYGYCGPRLGDTFQAIKKHAYANVLLDVGSADLTFHVDFAALASALQHGGAVVSPVVAQKDFLKSLGAVARTQVLVGSANAMQKQQLESALIRLTAPSAMGDLFKAVCAVWPSNIQPAGFSSQ